MDAQMLELIGASAKSSKLEDKKVRRKVSTLTKRLNEDVQALIDAEAQRVKAKEKVVKTLNELVELLQ